MTIAGQYHIRIRDPVGRGDQNLVTGFQCGGESVKNRAFGSVGHNVFCSSNKNLNYYLSGVSKDSSGTIFENLLEGDANGAQGVGVQIMQNDQPISAGSLIALGSVGTSGKNINLTARYQRTSGQVTAGNVKSIIGMTFTYQ